MTEIKKTRAKTKKADSAKEKSSSTKHLESTKRKLPVRRATTKPKPIEEIVKMAAEDKPVIAKASANAVRQAIKQSIDGEEKPPVSSMPGHHIINVRSAMLNNAVTATANGGQSAPAVSSTDPTEKGVGEEHGGDVSALPVNAETHDPYEEVEPHQQMSATNNIVPNTDFRSRIKPTPTAIEQKMISDVGASVSRPVSFYRRISFGFALIAVVLASIASYFYFVKTTITIEPKAEAISSNLLVDIYDESVAPTKDGAVVGVVKEMDVQQTATYAATGGVALGSDVIGKVTLINNYDKAQPLVAKTRLLTADNKLFRLKETVTIPAGGSIEAEIYADQPSAEMAFGPTKFTIPGLWAGLQDKIYAESSAAINYAEKKQLAIDQADIDNGVKDLRDQLVRKVSDEVKAGYEGKYAQYLYKIDDASISSESDGKAGEEKVNFNITLKAKVVVVAFNDEPVNKLVEQKLRTGLANDKEVVEFDAEKIVYTLASFDVNAKTASVDSTFEAKTLPKNGADFIDKSKLISLSADQLTQYLSSLPGVASFEVKFSPSFIKKTPSLADRIIVNVKGK